MLEELLKEARTWLLDCGMKQFGQSKNDKFVALAIHTYYDGRWPAFVAADPAMDEYTARLEMDARWGCATAEKFLPVKEDEDALPST
jgi:hypothetical protein